jgi:hypothetical protein
MEHGLDEARNVDIRHRDLHELPPLNDPLNLDKRQQFALE